MRICAHCGKEIKKGESHFSFWDNFLQVKYFDSEEDNIFCSQECACAALMLTEIENNESEEDEDTDEKEDWDPESVEVDIPEAPNAWDYNKPYEFVIDDDHYMFHTWAGALATYCEYLCKEYGAETVKDAILQEKERRKGKSDFWGFPFYDKWDKKTGCIYKLRDTELYIHWNQTEVGIEKMINALGNLFPDTRLKLVE